MVLDVHKITARKRRVGGRGFGRSAGPRLTSVAQVAGLVDHSDPRGHRAESELVDTSRSPDPGNQRWWACPPPGVNRRRGSGTVPRPTRGRANVVPESVSS